MREAFYLAGFTGPLRVEQFNFYIVFAMFRLAAIFHGIKARSLRGTASLPRAEEYGAGVGWLAHLAWSQTVAPPQA